MGNQTEWSPWFTVGREYDVLELDAYPGGKVLFRIETDSDRVPALAQSGFFVSVSMDVPTNWTIELREGGSLTLGPAAWRRPSFWEDYFDGDPEAVRVYEEEAEKVRTESDG